MKSRRTIIKETIKMLQERYGVKVDGPDIFIYGGIAHLCTSKTAELFHTSYHNFCNVYVPCILQARTHRIIAGRHKYYNITETLNILTVSRDKGISIFDACDIIEDRYKKKKRRK
jgi:hypothetical protein